MTYNQIEKRLADPKAFFDGRRELQELLRREPTLKNYYFAHRLMERFGAEAFERRIRIALLTSYTTDFIIPLLRAELMFSDIDAEFYKPHYNQFRQELLDPDSGLYRFQCDVTIVGFNLEDVFPEAMSRFSTLTADERRALRDEAARLFESIVGGFRQHAAAGAFLLVQDVTPPFDSYEAMADGDSGIQAFVDEINRDLKRTLAKHPGTYVLQYARLVNERGRRSWTDPRMYYTARIPVARQHWIPLAARYAAYIRALLNDEVKCIVLDLDNTLWGGVLGEDGVDGIRIGGDYPGLVYRRFQEYLLGLYAHGYVLAISSKNNYEDVMEVFRRRPEMALREKHFAAIRVNWNPKEQSIREISNEIQISLDHMLFVDDNPIEIAKVRAALPGVSCLHLESPPLDFIGQFESQRCIGKLLLTEEDFSRGRQYSEDRRRREVRQTAATLEDFYRRLQQRLTVYVNHRPHASRIAQLTQRTNQFNMTTLRLGEADVERLMSSPDALLLTASLRDEFGDSGVVAYVQIRKNSRTWFIDNFLMSCRVLGRTVEERLVDYICGLARRAGVEKIVAAYIPTRKNAPFAGFYSKNGFVETETDVAGGKRFELPAGNAQPRETFVEIEEYGVGIHA